ncbi:MAG: transcriptional regulator GutM [Peptostreptococcaceae bacterium]|nr:transcriptional regulator GutM [Peptostreptococcaceae bacterium]
MGNMILILFFVLAIQGILALFQIKDFQKNARELQHKGKLGIGNVRRKFSAGAIVLLCVDANKIVVEGRLMEGISIFAKFRPYTAYNGSKLTNVLVDVEKKLEEASAKDIPRLQATLKAAQMLLESYENTPERAEEFTEIAEEGEIVDAVITAESSEMTEELYEKLEDFNEQEEPQIIDVEEIRQADE